MKRILVTGAAGLIGGEVCARLVAAGHTVTALIHRNPEVRGNDGAPVATAETLACDIAQDRLGLDAATFDRLARDHDLVIHCAATIRFDLTDEEYARTNTQGTANVIALAQAGGAYHLVPSRPLPMRDFAAGIGGVEGLHVPALVDPSAFDAHDLPPLERRLHSRVSALYASYFQRDPRFDDRRFRALTGIEPGPADKAYLSRLIGFCVDQGFLLAGDNRAVDA